MNRFAVLLLTLTAALPAWAVSDALPLQPGSHRYHFQWDGQLAGDAVRTLSCEARQCRLHTEASVPGMATLQETSHFSWQHHDVVFGDYERTLQLLFFPQVVKLSRGPDDTIIAERKGKVRTYPASPGLLDALSLEAQLRADLIADGKPRAQYLMADAKGTTVVQLEELPPETLTVGERPLETRVFRRRNAEGSRITTLWLDPAQQFLPIRITHQDGSETYRLNWLARAD